MNKNTVYCKYMNLVTIYKTYIHISMMDSLTISAVIKKNICTIVPYICIWVASLYTQIFSWRNLKKNIYIRKSKINQYCTYNISMIYSWYGQGAKQELLLFLENLNNKYKTIKFEHNISPSNISFLNILRYKDQDNTFQTTIYHKLTD